MTEFVTEAVRTAIEQRHVQTEFQARGEAAWERYWADGETLPDDEVLNRLQAKLDAKQSPLSRPAK